MRRNNIHRKYGNHNWNKNVYQKQNYKPRFRNNRSESKEFKDGIIEKNINAITTDNRTKRRYTWVKINKAAPICMQLDCGVEVTIISEETWKKIGSPKLDKAQWNLKAANGSRIEVMGQFETEFLWKNFNGYGSCYVSQEVNDIMGLDWMEKLPPFRKLFTDLENHNISIMSIKKEIKKDTDLIEKIKEKYPNIFKNGSGLCKLTKAKLSIKEGVKPVFCKPRKIPYRREQLVEKELDRLINDGVIKKVDYSKWAAPIVAITKANGNIRICADFKTGLNKVLESHTHPLPTPDDIFIKLMEERGLHKLILLMHIYK